jgi:hypothetical protein
MWTEGLATQPNELVRLNGRRMGADEFLQNEVGSYSFAFNSSAFGVRALPVALVYDSLAYTGCLVEV